MKGESVYEILNHILYLIVPYPGPPMNVKVDAISDDTIEACWDKPEKDADDILYYTVHYKELPRFPFSR